MVALCIAVSLISIFSSVIATPVSEGMILDDVLAEMSSMRNDACSSYKEVSDAWRHIDYVNRGNFPRYCDKTGNDTEYRKDTNLAWGSWYRFTGAAGTKLPTAPAPVGGGPDWGNQICGTTGVAYISSGDNPTIQDGIVKRDVCFELTYDSCFDKITVGVAACRDMHGEYFVYQLQPVPGCNMAYCAID